MILGETICENYTLLGGRTHRYSREVARFAVHAVFVTTEGCSWEL